MHEVKAGKYHTSIVIFATSDSKFYGNPDYNFKPLKGQSDVQYMTIGAGPAFLLSGDPLTADYNRKKDAQLWRKNTLQNLYINNEWVVDNLISNTEYYMKNYQAETDYILIPKKIVNTTLIHSHMVY